MASSSKRFNGLWTRCNGSVDRHLSSLKDGVAMLHPLPIIVMVLAGVLALANTADQAVAQAADTGALQLEAKIPLGDVRGRIDHMAIDLARQHFFVAELENNTVGIVDLASRKVIQTIQGMKEPQG